MAKSYTILSDVHIVCSLFKNTYESLTKTASKSRPKFTKFKYISVSNGKHLKKSHLIHKTIKLCNSYIILNKLQNCLWISDKSNNLMQNQIKSWIATKVTII